MTFIAGRPELRAHGAAVAAYRARYGVA
jgi:hypothetical protein